MDADPEIESFVGWFQSAGGSVDLSVMGITTFPDSGRGAIALRDIPVRPYYRFYSRFYSRPYLDNRSITHCSPFPAL